MLVARDLDRVIGEGHVLETGLILHRQSLLHHLVVRLRDRDSGRRTARRKELVLVVLILIVAIRS